jgi:hypothetical protein
MKIFLYFVLIIAFLMFYQTNPMYAAVFMILFLGVFLFFKLRKRGEVLSGVFFSGQNNKFDKRFDDIMLLILMQQLLTSNSDHNNTHSKNQSKKNDIKTPKPKNEVLELLKE